MTPNEKLSAQVIADLEHENARLRDLICAWWRNAINPMWYMRKKDIKETIAIVAEKNKEDNK